MYKPIFCLFALIFISCLASEKIFKKEKLSTDYISIGELRNLLKRNNKQWIKDESIDDELFIHDDQYLEDDDNDNEVEQDVSNIDYKRPIESSTCGRPQIAPIIEERIYGGSEAVPHSWPWQVFYQEEKSCGTEICFGVCGGTLLNARYVLTAAHCINNASNPAAITIVAGLHNKELQKEQSRRQFVQVTTIFMNPGWDAEKLENDLAILRLDKPVTFNRYVQPVCLPGPDPRPGSTVYLIGWGAELLNGKPHHVLKQAAVRVIGNCNEYWPNMDDAKQICLGHRKHGFSACQGDSGGSALQKHSGQWVIEGVASYVSDCKTHDDLPPNVYVRVSAYLPWIKSIINT